MGQNKAVLTVTRPRAAKIRKIIRNAAKFETLIYGSLYDRDPNVCHTPGKGMGKDGCDNVGRCAMGELLFQVGYGNNDLNEMNGGGDWGAEVYKRLWEAYRIDRKDVEALIDGNDKVTSTINEFSKRQVVLEKVITKLDKKRGRVNPHLTRLNYNGNPIGPMPSKKEVAVLVKFGVYDQFLDQVDNEEDGY